MIGSRMFRFGMGHVDLGPQRLGAVGELALAHPLEQVEVLLDRAVAVGAVLARLGQRAAVLADLVAGQVADVRLALLDQLDRPLVHLLEVVGGVEEPVVPVGAEPADVLDDRIDVLLLFLLGVGVVEAQVELAAELRGDAVVQADALGVADVQIAVRLRREPRRHAPAPFARLQVVRDHLPDEVQPPFPAAFLVPVRPVARQFLVLIHTHIALLARFRCWGAMPTLASGMFGLATRYAACRDLLHRQTRHVYAEP